MVAKHPLETAPVLVRKLGDQPALGLIRSPGTELLVDPVRVEVGDSGEIRPCPFRPADERFINRKQEMLFPLLGTRLPILSPLPPLFLR